ncbi:MAG: hypothetical protein O2973_07525 [Gemmatimonadetes bacterium]|nr:hypothetical protein [Gemmatimonadota bacterium]
MINETRERFIRAIAERLDPRRIVELHLFPSIRQGPIETGVAVIAATPMPAEAVPTVVSRADAPEPELELETVVESTGFDQGTPERTEVFTATYVWTRKGPERGKWVVDVNTEARAPLPTVETVVRGVQVRSGEAMDAYRMTASEIRELLGLSEFDTDAGTSLDAVAVETSDSPVVAANEPAPSPA